MKDLKVFDLKEDLLLLDEEFVLGEFKLLLV